MKELTDCIKNCTIGNTEEVEFCVRGMVCSDIDPIPLAEEDLLDALEVEGEFLVLKLHYSDFEDELKSQKIKRKISQALSVIVSYEDDGDSFAQVNEFIKYVHDASDVKQNSTFGVKSVEKLSEFPITILFSGIFPINQLRITVGRKIDELIHSDDSYFVPRFAKHRDDISREVGIPILPVLPAFDASLGEFQVRLVDMVEDRVVAEFEADDKITKETTEIYLLKLFYVYKVLVDEKRAKNNLR